MTAWANQWTGQEEQLLRLLRRLAQEPPWQKAGERRVDRSTQLSNGAAGSGKRGRDPGE